MSRFGNAQDEAEDVEADELTGDEVDDGLDLDRDEWEDEGNGGDPYEAPEEPQEPPQAPTEPAPDPTPAKKSTTPRRRK